MSDKVAVLHLRSSAGSGGGPEKTILKTGQFIDQTKFFYIILYIAKTKNDLSNMAQRAQEARITYYGLPGSRLIDFRQLRDIRKLIEKHKVMILHCHDPKTDFYGLLLKYMYPHLKLVSTMHGWFHRTWKSLIYKRLDLYFLRFFDAVIAVSRKIEDMAKKHNIKNTVLIYNAIDTDEWRPLRHNSSLFERKQPQAFVIGFIGRLSKEKGPLDFVRAANNILQHDAAFEFVVAGEGTEMTAMINLTKRMGIANKFHFLGHVPNREMPALYENVDALLSTSHTEGFPNNILEAFAMHVPVIATNVGGVSEIINDGYNGLLANPRDINTLANHALTIKKHRELASTLIKNGRITVENNFTFGIRVRKIQKLYNMLMKN